MYYYYYYLELINWFMITITNAIIMVGIFKAYHQIPNYKPIDLLGLILYNIIFYLKKGYFLQLPQYK